MYASPHNWRSYNDIRLLPKMLQFWLAIGLAKKVTPATCLYFSNRWKFLHEILTENAQSIPRRDRLVFQKYVWN